MTETVDVSEGRQCPICKAPVRYIFIDNETHTVDYEPEPDTITEHVPNETLHHKIWTFYVHECKE